VVFPEGEPKKFDKPWATTGAAGRKHNIINSLYLDPEVMEKHIHHLFRKFEQMRLNEQRSESWMVDDQPEVVICAYGTTARIAKSAIRELRKQGVNVGLFRPITVWPYPVEALRKLIEPTKVFLTVEMSMGQMVQDVRAVVEGKRPVKFFGRTGGMVPTVEEIVAKVKEELAALRA
jgi:2-oxoglutarate ferredoxin oxidoreductase subunit alpha